jgi:hypothetical protein
MHWYVSLKDGELMLDPDVDGIDASLMLSTNKGLVDIFTDECLLSPLHGTVYNINFRRHDRLRQLQNINCLEIQKNNKTS